MSDAAEHAVRHTRVRRLGIAVCAAACLLGCKDKPASQTAGAGSSVGSAGADGGGGGSASVGSSGSAASSGQAWDAGSGSAVVSGSASPMGAGSGSATDASGSATQTASGSATEPTGGSAAGVSGAGAVDPGTGNAGGTASDELEHDDKGAAVELRIAFANDVPKLPAVSADGAWIADYGSDALRPMRPSPIFVRVMRLDGKGKSERLELVDDEMAQANADAGDWDVNPPPASVVKVLRGRAAAVAARLRGFASLSSVETRGSTKRSAKIGAFKLASTEKTDRQGGLQLVLTDARGKPVQREQIRSYSDGTHPEPLEGGACEYRPKLQGAYLDRTKRRLYVAVAFHWREECTPQEPRFVVWELAEPSPR